MCGISGYSGVEIPGLLSRMTDAIRHRGPDAEGFFENPRIHLGCRRLRVLDLDGGDQPISNEDRTVHIVYNGEIYNYRELRRQLLGKGHPFRTETDTEVIVHLYEEHGVDCTKYLNGMFAFALFDESRQRLLLARDPVGIKPLVYFWDGSTLVFASEAKSVLLHPKVSATLDPNALHQLLNVRFVPCPMTLFRGVGQLPPGHVLILENGTLSQRAYHSWNFPGNASLSPIEAAEGFLETLGNVMQRQMVADVPVGIFLSGGLDSSALVAGAHRAGLGSRLQTFTLGFDEPTDELEDAAVVAAHFQSDHHATTLTPTSLRLYPRMVFHTEVPKVNALQGYYLSRFVRQTATVGVSGLGGDELFLGYDIYRYLLPGHLIIDSAASSLAAMCSGLIDRMATSFDYLTGPRGENPRRALELLASGDDPLRYYTTLRNGWDLGAATFRKLYTDSWSREVSCTTRDAFSPYFDRVDLPLVEQVQWAEFRSKMVDDFLLNEDRTSMANSLEVRVPLLDLEMIEFAFSLPLRVKYDKRQLKPVMKRALSRVLPYTILRKKKWGFTFNPYEQFKKDLRGLCVRELTQGYIEKQGIFRYDFIRSILEAKPSPLLRWHYFMIWHILGLKYWQEIFLEGRNWEEIEERLAHGP